MPSSRKEMHLRVNHSISQFVSILRDLSAAPGVKEIIDNAPEAVKDGRSFIQICMDDFMDAFETIMCDVPDEKIPVEFYGKMMSTYLGQDVPKETVAEKLQKGLEEKRSQPEPPADKLPDFIEILIEDANPQVADTLLRNWSTTLNNFTNLVMDEDAIASMNAGRKLAMNHMREANKRYAMRHQNSEAIRMMGGPGMGGPDGMGNSPIDKLYVKLQEAELPPEVRKKAEEDLARLEQMQPGDPSGQKIEEHVDLMLSLPWEKADALNMNMNEAEKILDEDHYGMEKVKERIAGLVAVMNHTKENSGKIICLAGPPGVGKTSIGQSIAKATGRKYIRMALGGVRDESDIRGHRITYIGAKPGRILTEMVKAGVKNPMILLDEVDKLQNGGQSGNPADALLELLDPAQNNSFHDHFLDMDFDMSNVLFVCTANYLERMDPALRDRMEIVTLPGYIHEESLEIAKRYLVPKQMAKHKLTDDQISISEEALDVLIKDYTREAGVRQLEREIGNICEKAVIRMGKGETAKFEVTPETLEEFVGPKRFSGKDIPEQDMVGLINGLAFSAVGGSVLHIEATDIPSKKGFILSPPTGQLGEVMQESVKVATSLIRARASEFGISEEKLNTTEIHIDAPDDAPKDGPSAGAAITTCAISRLTGVPIKRDLAMTGKITLGGRVMPIGGVREKLDGARKSGVKTVLIPKENEKDLADVPQTLKDALEIIPVSTIEDVLKHALTGPLPKLEAKEEQKADQGGTALGRAWRAAMRELIKEPANDTGKPRQTGTGGPQQRP